MIDRAGLLADLQRLVAVLTDDLRAHADETASVADALTVAHAQAVEAGRTAMAVADWREGELTQAAVAWVLACVLVRFCEDNGLIDEPLLSGPGARRDAALGRRTVFFEERPALSDREYLQWCFAQVARFPALAALYDARHTPLERLVPSVDGAAALRELWIARDPATGDLVHDFTDARLGTRFLGDLYQELSEAAKKRYALLQTPDFVESFILDRTLEPALDEFGLSVTRMIDPTCGSGHFLISAFERLYARWVAVEPGTPAAVLAQRALDQVHGVDLNPFAVAIARFRLVVAALRVCGIRRLAEAPALRLNLATGDSLLHGPEPGRLAGMERMRAGIAHVYDTEDAPELARILGQGYHAVVGNPPYINVQDSSLRDSYRERYDSCHGKYALSVPFMERFFELARPEVDQRGVAAGYVGKITANSFMKREFGGPLVERFLPGQDVRTIIDTSGAYIPGHGTPTVVLFGRSQPPVGSTLRVLDAVRGEPTQPADPARGLVWSAIRERVDQPGTEDRYVRAGDVERAEFAAHPMTLGVGRDLRKALEADRQRLHMLANSLGFASFSGMDDGFVIDGATAARTDMASDAARVFVIGDAVRDWGVRGGDVAIAPYDTEGRALPLDLTAGWAKMLWPNRTVALATTSFGGRTRGDLGDDWWTWYRWVASKYATPLTITWGEVATHNHFVLDRGGKVFNRTAPVIKLPASASEDDHLRLLGVLNSSTACFWLKQVCQGKGNGGIGGGIGDEAWEPRHALNSTKVQEMPLPAERPLDLAKRLDALARERAALLDDLPPADLVAHARALAAEDVERFAQMVALQEELDWQALALYGLVGDDLPLAGLDAPPLALGERAFEIVLARQVERKEVETAWFERHGSTPITDTPDHWPADYAALVDRRIALIESDPDVGLIERPEHKRRWTGQKPFTDRLHARLRSLILDALEQPAVWPGEPALRTVSDLADVVRRDRQLADACTILAGDPDAEVGDVVARLVLDEAVPFLAALRHTEAGLRKRAGWEQTWELQRAEDRGEDVGPIPVPSRYAKSDFRADASWRLRGKLDVPKERFVLVPGARRGAGTSPVIGWAGWDEAQRARALAARVLELQTAENADAVRLSPLLAGVLELLPWVDQWHPDPDPATGQRLGPFLEDWLDGTLSGLG